MDNSYKALVSVKLSALYQQLDKNHIYMHANKSHHSHHIYTPTYTQSIATEMHGLPRPVKSAVQKGKS